MTYEQNSSPYWEVSPLLTTQPSETTNNVLNTSTQSLPSLKNTSIQDGISVNGTNSLVSVEQLKPVAQTIAAATSVQALNAAVGDKLTRAMRREHRALMDLKNSAGNNSLQRGCKNTEIIRRPDYLFKALQKAGLLDEYADHMPMNIGRFKRMGMAGLNLSFMYEYQEEILDAIEDHTPYNGMDGFRILTSAWMMAAGNQYVVAESPLIDDLAHLLKQLPTSEAHKLLTAN